VFFGIIVVGIIIVVSGFKIQADRIVHERIKVCKDVIHSTVRTFDQTYDFLETRYSANGRAQGVLDAVALLKNIAAEQLDERKCSSP